MDATRDSPRPGSRGARRIERADPTARSATRMNAGPDRPVRTDPDDAPMGTTSGHAVRGKPARGGRDQADS